MGKKLSEMSLEELWLLFPIFLGELDKTKKIYVMCQSGLRSYLATRILMQNGFDAYNFAGGFRLYSSIKNEELLSKQCYSCGMEK